MNKNIIYISDFFAEHVLGGAELNDFELLHLLREKGYNVSRVQSHLVDDQFLDKNKKAFFIISNFMNIKFKYRERLTYEADYIIYEHDHKYLHTRNPAHFKNFEAPGTEIRNYFFYKNAKKVFCQSDFHKNIILKNLDIDNVVSVNGNLWSLKALRKLEALCAKEKNDCVSILDSSIGHKNTSKAVEYCRNKGLSFDLVKDSNYESFLEKLSQNNKLVFLPGSPETLSRIVCEARMMGMSAVINKLVGAGHEPWFKMKGKDLINYMIGRREWVTQAVSDVIEASSGSSDLKKVSIITTFHKAEEFLESYLKNITSQTMFSDCELVLVDSGSPGSEQEIVKKYMDKYDNIKYFRYKNNFKPTIGHNIAIKKSTSKFIVWAMIDDRKSLDGIQALFEALDSNVELELAYGDCLSTKNKNESVETTTSTKLSEHSINQFSRENMIKCLPGPMPMWRKRLHEKCGFFDEINHDFSDDWDLWLRAVNAGCVFEKVNRVVGLYMEGGRSQWNDNADQRREEAKIFFKNSHIFGRNYEKYRMYFSQFIA
jgi:glycosyltransferase involved in cell wall biosynthesis